jgi:ATP-dependent DNA helicase RecG
MADYKLPKPEVTVSGQDFIITLRRPSSGGLKGGQISGQKNYSGLTPRQIEILNYIIANNQITRKELTDKVGINSSAIQRHLQKLKTIGLLERAGTKGGHWIVQKEE